ncbi:hypothetical protein D0Z08_12565 [Nocardioides immobilis]|uniref:HNH endonuclease n=1 Tax=Nocardioides immobilis TaxID=2049295 RepID=A0A417Y1Q7_9ACTN|nr:HNH endonuclease signature motif containing protein [Nocardioides immobilis]RHW26598.1 hypothetical protein D0Z08_12565 [Nocardioides immobilis]
MGTPGTSVLVRPVIDLNGHQPVDSYEIPDRIRRQVELADHHCTYPCCTRPAERCDLDHNVPHTQGGPTCRCNLNPKCRGHHRYKTSGLATCRILSPGTYLWTLPSGLYLVDPTGTYDLTPDPAPPSRPSRRPTRPIHPTSSHRAPHPRHLVPPAGISARSRGGFEAPRCVRRTSTTARPAADRDHPPYLPRPQPERAPQTSPRPPWRATKCRNPQRRRPRLLESSTIRQPTTAVRLPLTGSVESGDGRSG